MVQIGQVQIGQVATKLARFKQRGQTPAFSHGPFAEDYFASE
jgi:hypothetical protein